MTFPGLRRLFLFLPFRIYLLSKLLVCTALVCGLFFFREPLNDWNYLTYRPADSGLIAPFLGWDGQHYLRLAGDGYPPRLMTSSAFYPLFPAVIRVGVTLGLDPRLSALLVVSFLSFCLLLCLYSLLPDDERGPSSLWLFVSFPSAFFLSTVYSESLFLLVLVLLLMGVERGSRLLPLSISAFLLPLVRGQGLLILVPSLLAFLCAAVRKDNRSLLVCFSVTTGILAGSAIYFLFYLLAYGDPMAGLEMQKQFVFGNRVENLFDLNRFSDLLQRPSAQWFSYDNPLFDKLVFVVVFCLSVISVRFAKSVFSSLLWFSMLLMPAMMGNLGSYSRFALVPWMFFCVYGGPHLSRLLKVACISMGFCLQVLLACRFGGNHWVA